MQRVICFADVLKENDHDVFPSGERSESENDTFFYPKASKRFTDLAIIIRTNDKRDLVQLEIILLLVT